jgi:hypothetical protein
LPKNTRFGLLPAIAAIVVVGLWTAWAAQKLVFAYFGWPHDQAVLGQWGDTFGGLNALFTALGFIAVLITIRQQQKQIEWTLADLHRQRFEALFFDLLGLLREARDEVRFRPSVQYRRARKRSSDKETVQGQAAFRSAIYEVRYWLRKAKVTPLTSNALTLAPIYRSHVHIRYESTLSPYFRLLYTILRRISSDPGLSTEEKARYGNIVRSQLTSFELGLVGLNALMAEANDFNRYVVEFRLLKYLPQKQYLRRLLEQVYPHSTFNPRD